MKNKTVKAWMIESDQKELIVMSAATTRAKAWGNYCGPHMSHFKSKGYRCVRVRIVKEGK